MLGHNEVVIEKEALGSLISKDSAAASEPIQPGPNISLRFRVDMFKTGDTVDKIR